MVGNRFIYRRGSMKNKYTPRQLAKRLEKTGETIELDATGELLAIPGLRERVWKRYRELIKEGKIKEEL